MFNVLMALWMSVAPAAELAGVTLPDTTTASDGSALVLNGLGLREKLWIDIYVGGLYLPTKTTDANAAIMQDVPKQIVMHFTYRKVTQNQMIDTFREGVAKSPKAQSLTAQMQQLEALIDRDILRDEEVVLEYIPGAGTSISIQGTKTGTIAGKDFMEAIWSIFLGETPASGPLKRGMMGG